MGIFATSVDDPQYASNMGLFRGIASGDVVGGIEAAQEGLLNRKIKQVDLSAKQLAEKRAQATFEMMMQAYRDEMGGGAPGAGAAPLQPSIAPQPGGAMGSGTFGIPTGGQGASAPPQGPQQGPGGDVSGQLSKLSMQALLGIPGVKERLDILKYRNDPQQRAGGNYYVNPVTGKQEYFAKLPDGMTPDGNGGARVMPGFAQGAADIAGATTGAQEAAKDRFAAPTTINLPGGPRLMMPAAARALAGGGAAPAPAAAQSGGVLPTQIPPAQQAAMDRDRVGILQAELPKAQARLTAALQSGDREGAQRAALDVSALNRELGRAGPAAGAPPAQGQGGPGVALQSEPEKASLMKTAEATAADVAEQRKSIMNSGFNAPSNIAKYKQLGTLLEGVDGGRLTQTGTNIASTMNSLGLKIDKNLPNKEAAAALGNQMALELRSPAGGAGMPGALSDKDREFLVGMVPNAGQTAQGRKMLIDSYVAMQQRNQQVATFARNYEKKYGRLDNGFFDQMQAWSNANPLFGGK